MHGCALSIVATDALVLKHQVISTHSTDYIFIVLIQFHSKILQLLSFLIWNVVKSQG